MKSRLFLKILLAFWVTFALIIQGVWLLFLMNSDRRVPPEALMAEFVAPVVLGSAAEAVTRAGPAGMRSMATHLPADQAARIAIAPLDDGAKPPVDDAQPLPSAVSRTARAPDGQLYRISYRYRAANPPIFPLLSIPPELLLVGLIGGLGFAATLAWYLTAPINRLRRGFEQLAAGDLAVRLAPAIGNRRDELADLGRDFDRMARQLGQLVEARDRLLHHVSHELRSPLARLQLAVALGRKTPGDMTTLVERIERETVRLESLVDELLTLARAESGQTPGDDYFDLAGIVSSVAEDARFEAQEQMIEIVLSEHLLPESQRRPMQGDAGLVRRAIDNIVRNALRFSPPDSKLRITVDELHDRQCSLITVQDQGPGIPDPELGTIFEPFVRADQRGSGFGLGLTIASRAIAAHGGTLMAHNHPSGGLEVEISLPTPVPG